MIKASGWNAGNNKSKEDENVRKAVQEAYDDGRYVAAICAAPTILADMGLLKGKRATCYQAWKVRLKMHIDRSTSSN